MAANGESTGFAVFRLLVENVAVWELVLVLVVVWLMLKPELLARVTRLKFGDVELELDRIRRQVDDQREEIASLEMDLEQERRWFADILEGFDPNAPVEDLAVVRDAIQARARTLSDLDEVRRMLGAEADASELYAAAVTFRDRRPTALVPDLLDCLERLSRDPELLGIRLHTVWWLTSALHRTLIASVRDDARPRIDRATLERARSVLDVLEANPRVQGDRPEAPDRGVRGPARHARSWIERGLAAAD